MKKLAIAAVTLIVISVILCILFPLVLIRSCEISEKKDELAWQRFKEIADVCDQGYEAYDWVDGYHNVYCGSEKKGNLSQEAEDALSDYGQKLGVTYDRVYCTETVFDEGMSCFSFSAQYTLSDDDGGTNLPEITEITDIYFVCVQIETLQARVVSYYPDAAEDISLVSLSDGAIMVSSGDDVRLIDCADGSFITGVGGEGRLFIRPADGYVPYEFLQEQADGKTDAVYGLMWQEGRTLASRTLDRDYGQLSRVRNGVAAFETYDTENVWIDLASGDRLTKEEWEKNLQYRYLKENCFADTKVYEDGLHLTDAEYVTILNISRAWLTKRSQNLKEIAELRVIGDVAADEVFCYDGELYLTVWAERPAGWMPSDYYYFLYKLDLSGDRVSKIGYMQFSEVRYVYRSA